MSLTENNGLSAADVAAVTGNHGGFGGMGYGDGSFWIIILFLFAWMGNGWGGFGNGRGNGATAVESDVQRGFDQQAVMSSLNGINTAMSNGFANAEISRCNSQANILQTLNNNQNATTAGMNGLAMGLQNCCCENRAATADLKYTVATEACSDRQAVNDAMNSLMVAMKAGFQGIHDQMCQDKIDAKNDEIANLRTQLSMKDLAASQAAQTGAIIANNEVQTRALEQYLNPAPIPAYVVQNPNCCGQTGYGGCGCMA